MKQGEEPFRFGAKFWGLAAGNFLFFAGFNMIIPELSDFLTSIGGADYKGLIISMFTLAALISRPFSGKLSDVAGRVPVMLFGALVSALCGYLYVYAGTVAFFLALRFFHGFSTGFSPTGITAYVSDITPASRRGEIIGLVGLMGTLGMSAGLALGSQIAFSFSMETMFYASAGVSAAAALILWNMKETITLHQRFSWKMLRINTSDFYERKVGRPALIFILLQFPFGAIFTLSSDHSKLMGIENKGLSYSLLTIASMSTRFFAGKLSDRVGREAVLRMGALILTIAMAMMALAPNQFIYLTATVLVGLGLGINSPTMFAWVIDLSDDRYRGRALATTFMALEISIGLSALLSGWIYGNDAANIKWAYLLCALVALAAFFVLVPRKK